MAKDAKNNKEVKNKKHFFKDFKAELKKVIWPTPKQITNSTIAVITIVIIAAVIVFALDFVFKLFNEQGINRLKSVIKEKTAVETIVEGTEPSEENAEGTDSSEENIEETENVEENNNEVLEQEQTSVENVQE